MKVKNSLILSLANNGLANTTNHDVAVKDAYKVFRFKDGIMKASNEIEEKRKAIVTEAGIEDASAFDDRRRELASLAEKTEEQKQELAKLDEQYTKYQDLLKELLDDETEIPNLQLISFDSYHSLSSENRQTRVQVPSGEGNKKMTTVYVDIFQQFMSELENILWKAPEDEESE